MAMAVRVSQAWWLAAVKQAKEAATGDVQSPPLVLVSVADAQHVA